MTEVSNIIIKEGSTLIPLEDWKSYILELKELVKKLEESSKKKFSEKDLIQFTQEKLIQAVKDRIPKKRFGIFFSGGIDSTLIAFICKKLGADFICYTVGIENSDDLIIAEKVALSLNLKLKTKKFTLEEMHIIFKKLVKIIPRDIVSMGVGSVVYAAAEMAKKDKIDILFSGLGSEELFAGYQRHDEAEDINEECWNGLLKMHTRDFIRDYNIASYLNFKILTPFLDKNLVVHSMQISDKLKINNGYKKVIIRKVAENLGIPKEFAWRKKKAAQYGSKFDRAILRLAKRNGFKLKKEYLESL